MRKQFLILTPILVIGFVLFFVFAYDRDISNDSLADPLVIGEESVESFFEENSFCVAQKQSIQDELSIISKENAGIGWNEILDEVFYSNQHDSCLYVSEVRSDSTGTSLKRLVDYRSSAGSDPLYSCEYIFANYIFNKAFDEQESEQFRLNKGCNTFDEKVIQLKNGETNVPLYE